MRCNTEAKPLNTAFLLRIPDKVSLIVKTITVLMEKKYIHKKDMRS